MRFKNPLSATLFAGLLSTAGAATTFTDPAAFLSNVAPASYLETFSTAASPAASLSFSGGGYSYSVLSDPSLPPASNRVQVNYGAIFPVVGGQKLQINFTSGNVTAVGGEFFRADLLVTPNNVLLVFVSQSVSILLGDGTTTTFTPGNQPGAFRGFTSTVPITSLTIDATPGSGLLSVMDNLRVGTALPVPEPGAWLMMGLGIAALALGKRKQTAGSGQTAWGCVDRP